MRLVHTKKLPIILSLLTFMALPGALFLRQGFAAAGQMYVSPASASVQDGDTITVAVRLNPGTNVDSAQTTVAYDQSKLEFVSVDTAASAFPLQIAQSGGSGTVTLVRSSTTGVSSDALIGTITFKALAGSGSTAVQLSSSGAYPSNATNFGAGTYINPALASGAINFTSPPASNPGPSSSGSANSGTTNGSGGSSSPGNSSAGSSGSGSSKSQSGASKTAGVSVVPSNNTANPNNGTSAPTAGTPALSANAASVEFTRAAIAVTSSTPVTTYVQYGLAPDRLTVNTPAAAQSTGEQTIVLDSSLLIPGTTYFYRVAATDAQGRQTVTAVQTFTTQGYTLRLRVLDKNNQPLRRKQVTLHSTPRTGTTDAQGYVTFANVAPGTHHVLYAAGGQTYSQSVYVKNSVQTPAGGQQAAPAQNTAIAYTKVNDGLSGALSWSVVAAVAVVTAIVMGGASWLRSRKNRLAAVPAALRGGQDIDLLSPQIPRGAAGQPLGKVADHSPVTPAPGLSNPAPGNIVAPQEPSKSGGNTDTDEAQPQ